MIYAILCNPGHNRVYFETSLKLAISEFNIVAQKLSTVFENVQHQNIYGVDYLTFQTAEELSLSDIATIFELSFIYALFKIEHINSELYLKPIEKIKDEFVDDSIGTILKYTGKTNEIFTRLMINIAYYSQDNRDNIRLLDPLAGKGTTLYEGLIKGYDVYGIEIGTNIVNESYHFVKKFLETARYKFEHDALKLSGENKAFTSLRHTFKIAKTKEDFKSKNIKTLELIAGNSVYANKYYKKNYFDIIVGDLPYGVQHGIITNEKQTSLTRNPTELLTSCLPVWYEVLKPNGIIVLSWNNNVLSRKKMEELFDTQYFAVQNDGAYLQFEHRVDQAILRDIIVVRKI